MLFFFFGRMAISHKVLYRLYVTAKAFQFGDVLSYCFPGNNSSGCPFSVFGLVGGHAINETAQLTIITSYLI